MRIIIGFIVFIGIVAMPSLADAVLVADRYFDAEKAKMVSPAILVVKDDLIVAVNPDRMPEGLTVKELKGQTILPGFLDAHTHITQDATGSPSALVAETGVEMGLLGAANARKTLLAGFTTIRDLGAGEFADIALVKAINEGWVPGPTIIAAGHGVGATGGHCGSDGHSVLSSTERGNADGADEVIKAIRQQVKNGAKVIKICSTAGVMSMGSSVGARQMTDAELSAAVAEANRQGLKVAAHAHGTEGIIAAVKAGVSSIEHGSFLTEEAVKLFKKSKTVLVPTLYLLDQFDVARLPEVLRPKAILLGDSAKKSFQLALRKGVTIAFGSDAAVIPHGDNAKEFSTRVALGQSPAGVLKSATLITASLLGVPDRGVIKPGKKADLITVYGNPLEDIKTVENVAFVMKHGVIYKENVK